MLNTLAGSAGLAVQISIFAFVYLWAAPRRGRSIAALYAAVAAVDGYALVLLGGMTVGLRWQAANLVLLVACALVVIRSRSLRSALRRSPRAVLAVAKSQWVPFVLVGAAFLLQASAVLLSPELSVDGQLYHGPALAQMVQTGWVWGWDAPNPYMFYTDLAMVSGLNLATFAGDTWFDNGVQLPHLLVLVLAVQAALRSRFRRAGVRATFALLIVAAPVIWLQGRVLYVDVAFGAAVATLAFLIVESRRPAVGDLLIAGVAGAAVLSIKPNGILTAGLLLVIYAVVAIQRRSSGPRLVEARVAVTTLATMAVPCLFALGFYVRNLVSFSNPVFPVTTSIGPVRLPGAIDLSVFASGERGSGFVDPGRLVSFGENLAHGAAAGVTKLDYDPRSGGFGHVPLMILALVASILLAQLLWIRFTHTRPRPWGQWPWRKQVALVCVAAALLLVQPATFDSRYVIGPFVILSVALLLSAVTPVPPRVIDTVAAALALVLVVGQVAWTESNMYPGFADLAELPSLSAQWQPATPGNIWGESADMAWLAPDDGDCVTIVVETLGGVQAEGLVERSKFGTLPYALYGEGLCNRVLPVELAEFEASALEENPLGGADYLLLYQEHLARWEAIASPGSCWLDVGAVSASEAYPQGVTVIQNTCV